MATEFDPEFNPPFSVVEPSRSPSPFVLGSPHSGRIYPASFLDASRLGNLAIRKSEDFLVDVIAETGVAHGMTLIHANFPRAYLDLNREPYELDPAMFEGKLPDHVNKKSLRVSSGLGTIARIVAEGEDIYRDKIPVEDGLRRVETLYKPYHEMLRNLLAKAHLHNGCAVLLDCHSMPSNEGMDGNERRADFVLGDRFGASCHPNVTSAAKIILENLGFHVTINRPYAGGFITEHYGRPGHGLHTLQIEINRALYMDEIRMTPSANFEALLRDMHHFFETMAQMDTSMLTVPVSIAAE